MKSAKLVYQKLDLNLKSNGVQMLVLDIHVTSVTWGFELQQM